VEHDETTGLGWPRDDLEHAPGGAGTDDEQSVVGFDQAVGVGDGMPDGPFADAMAPS